MLFLVQALQEQREEEVQKQRKEEVGQQEPSPEVPIWQPQQEQESKVRLPLLVDLTNVVLSTLITSVFTIPFNDSLGKFQHDVFFLIVFIPYRSVSKEKDSVDPVSDKKKTKEEKEDEKVEDVS